MLTVNNVTELVGRTPVLKLNKVVPKNAAHIYIKLEYFNPSGNVKDRATLNMIETAERDGLYS